MLTPNSYRLDTSGNDYNEVFIETN